MSKEGVIWYEVCLLRYSDKNFFSTINTRPFTFTCGIYNVVSTLVSAMSLVRSTLHKVANKVAAENLKFATVQVNVSNTVTLFSLAQCTLDLSFNNCQDLHCMIVMETIMQRFFTQAVLSHIAQFLFIHLFLVLPH